MIRQRKEPVKALGIEAFDHFGTTCVENYQSGGGAAVVDVEQFSAGGGGVAHVALFEGDALRFEEDPHHFAVEAAGLSEEEDALDHK